MTAQDVDTPEAGGPRRPNPEAIAWYVEEAQRLLEDQQRRAESLRTRGGQIAGFGAAVLALIVGSMFGLLGELGEGTRVIVGVELGMAGLLLAVAVATAIWGTLRPRGFAEISAEEIFRFTAEPFLLSPTSGESTSGISARWASWPLVFRMRRRLQRTPWPGRCWRSWVASPFPSWRLLRCLSSWSECRLTQTSNSRRTRLLGFRSTRRRPRSISRKESTATSLD